MNSNSFKTLLEIVEISHKKSLSFHEKLKSILEQVLFCMNTEKGSIMLLRGNNTFEIAASTNPVLVGLRHPVEEDTPSSWVVRNKRTLYMGPGGEETAFHKRFTHYKKEAFLLAPIMSRGKVIGVLSITDKKGEDTFSAEEQELLLTIASSVISTIESQRQGESLRRSRDEIKKKNAELQKLERVRTELFNMLIHDLKGPLSEIVANIDILSYTTADDDLERVQSAQSACDTLFRMISDLLDITRLEEGCINLLYEDIDPADLVHEAVIRLNSMAKARDIILKESIPGNRDRGNIRGDRGILLRVMQNLIVNAIQHSPAGEFVEVGFTHTVDGVLLHVQDHGPGIAPEYQDAVFNKFFQITKKNDGRRFSTGLGLTFCKMAIEAHFGCISVESDGEKGSLFVFSIPDTRESHLQKRKKSNHPFA